MSARTLEARMKKVIEISFKLGSRHVRYERTRGLSGGGRIHKTASQEQSEWLHRF
jgi:hypothetical protein